MLALSESELGLLNLTESKNPTKIQIVNKIVKPVLQKEAKEKK